MGVQPRVVVDIDHRQWLQFLHALVDLAEQTRVFTVTFIAAGPAAVEVRLVVEPAQALLCRQWVADQDEQGTWQFVKLVVALEEAANGFPAGDFISMLKHGDHQGALVTTLKVYQCGAINLLIQGRCRTLEKTIRYVIQLSEVQRNHNMPIKIQAIMTGRKCGRVIVGIPHE